MPAAIPKTNTYYAIDRAAWRLWLQQNHATALGIWLVYYKKESGKTRVPYADAVEEALCFGWIDSTLNPLDDEKYMQLFTPRKPKSGWSKLNKERAARLINVGLMTPAGMAKIEHAKQNGDWHALDHIENFTVPQPLAEAFEANESAKKFYESLSNTNKKYLLYYISHAKKEDAKLQRVAEIIAAANQGRMPDRYIR